jgi:predicted Zn finger-like uncharacterized protein
VKFLCDNCKAKYQISDEKVVGKTVRMKCRRCEHVIEIGPIDAASPSLTAGDQVGGSELAAPDGVGRPEPSVPPPASTQRLSAVPPRPAAAAPRPAPPPRPAGVARVGAPLRVAPTPAAPARGFEGHAATARALHPAVSEVASAFQRAAAEPIAAPAAPPAASPLARSTSSEDWYVGVGGVPLGPVRLAVIREKAMTGAVTGDSLVWREGFDEWLPLKTFPELLELIADAQGQLSAKRGAVPVALSAAPAAPSPLAPSPLAPSPLASAAPQASASAAPASATALDPAPAAVAAFAPAPAAQAGAHSGAASADIAPIGAMADPFAAPAPAALAPASGLALPTPARAAAEMPDDLPPRRRTGMHPMAYAFITMAGLFGAVAAYVLLVKEPKIVEKTVYVQASSTPAAPEPQATAASTAEPAPSATASVSSADTAKPVVGGPMPKASAPEPKSSAAAPPSGVDMSGFAGSGVTGPSAGGPSGSSSGSGGGQLSQSEISSVVSSNQATIRRKCWQPALEARSRDGATTARVQARIVIGPSGSVQSATASGAERDFPGLSSCIQGKVQGWKFPASGGTSTVSVPFVFAAQ